MRSFKLAVAAPVVLLLSHGGAQAQMSCGNAVAQLQQYVANVNQFANFEYNRNIPMRCGGNPQCMQMWLGHLNAWYMNQTGMVNGWYSQIVATCSSPDQNSAPPPRRIPSKRASRDSAPEMDEDTIANLDVDKEDKTVRIRIPSNPTGYK